MNAFLFVVVVLMPAIGAFIALRTMRRTRGGIRATAQVVGRKREDVPGPLDREYTWRDLPIVEFRDAAGKVHRVTLSEEIPDTDTTARIVFPRGSPRDARLDDTKRLYLVPALLIGPGLALVVLYVLASLYAKLAA